MKAVVYRGKDDLRLEEIPVPEPGAGEMLVRVDACGICPTDLKKIEKGLLAGPRVFGHEISGTVKGLGKGAQGFDLGQRVVVHHHIPCRSCYYCRRQVYAQCARYKENGTSAGFEAAGGGYAEYVKARDWIVQEGTIPVPDDVKSEEAVFVEPVNTCLKAVQKADVQKGETALVVGQGPIGLLLMQLLTWAGASVFVSDPLEERRRLGAELGAEEALDAGDDVVSEVRGLTDGRGVDVAFVAAVGAAPLDQAIAATRPGGRILSFAATSPGETAEVDLGVLTSQEKDLLTSYSASVDVQDQAAQLVFGREVRVKELVSHQLPIERALEAFDLAFQPGPGTLKVVVQKDTKAR